MITLNLTPTLALELWREAAAQEVGLRIPVHDQTDVEKIKTIFYDARKGHLELQDLMLCVGPEAKDIWLVKRPQEAP